MGIPVVEGSGRWCVNLVMMDTHHTALFTPSLMGVEAWVPSFTPLFCEPERRLLSSFGLSSSPRMVMLTPTLSIQTDNQDSL